MPIPTTIADYFRVPDAERILALEITRRTYPAITYYLSDSLFQTEATDLPAEMVFAPVIGGSGLPELRRSISDPFDGAAATSFGTVTLVNGVAPYVAPGGLLEVEPGVFLEDGAGVPLAWADSSEGLATMTLLRGASVVAKIAAPRRLYPYADAVTLIRGQIGKVGGDSDGYITVEITDGTDIVSRATVVVSDSPLCYGRCRNVSPLLIDPGALIYRVHDGEISSVLNVYDQGVLLTPVSQWTADLSTGQITLGQSPAGQITCDVDGAVEDGVFLSSTVQIVTDLLRRAGVVIEQDYASVNDGTIGLYLTETKSIGELLTALFRGAAAYWLVDRDGVLRADTYPVPGDGGVVYDETKNLKVVPYEDDERLHRSIRYSYKRNWTQYQAKAGATAAQAMFAAKAAETGTYDAEVYSDELIYAESQLLETYFDNQSNAIQAATLLTSLFSVQRKRLSVELPYSDTLNLGTPLTVYFNGRSYKAVITGIADVFNGAYPIQRLEVLA